jgi:hypothetical protein
MLYNPEWEDPNFKNGNGIRKRSLLENIQKLNPVSSKRKRRFFGLIKK